MTPKGGFDLRFVWEDGSVMTFVYLAWPCGFQIRSRIEPLIKHDSKWFWAANHVLDIPAAFLYVSDRQLNQLGLSLLGGERAPGLDRFADHAVQALNGFAAGMSILVSMFGSDSRISVYAASIRDRGTGSTKVRASRCMR